MDSIIRTLIVIDNLHTGGVATSMYNFLKYVDKSLQLDLLVFNEDSIDYKRLPIGVKVKHTQTVLHILGKNQQEIRKESLFLALIRGLLFILARMSNGKFARSFLWPFIKRMGNYDLCIAYAQDDGWKSLSKGCVDFILKRVSANNKAVLIHCDYKNFGGFHRKQVNTYHKLNYIICVSDSCRKSFNNCFPQLIGKTIVCENFTDIDFIQTQAGIGVTYNNSYINFVTICRISKVKGLDRAIKAFSNLLKEGNNLFHWTIVGDGPEMGPIAELIREEGLEDFINMEGEQSNPYPYLKNADWFLLPSYHEAAPMVFGESIALNVPILTTDTCSAKEVVSERGLGIVVENSEKGIYDGIKGIMQQTLKKPSMRGIDVNNNAFVQTQDFIKKLQEIKK